MDVLNFKKANCKNCYKCVRVCPVKSIQIKDQQAEILANDCILCGHCIEACPQNAKTVVSDVEKVKGFINSGNKVFVSLAPSFLGSFDFDEPSQVVAALKALGFSEVLETAEGAVLVTNEYHKTIEEKKMDNIITTCCPTVNDLVEKYYPNMVPFMAPTVSPMIAHGKTIKKTYGKDIKVVFIGPCISKKREAVDIRHEGYIDAVLTFDEVSGWLSEEKIVVKELEGQPFEGLNPKIARMYPISSGILTTLHRKAETTGYQFLAVDGIKQCMDLFEAIENGSIHNTFIEINACTGGCIHGPAVAKEQNHRFKAQMDTKKYALSEDDGYPEIDSDISFAKKFLDTSRVFDIPDEQTIREILCKIGKDTPDKELNCGFCGYPSCREKAIAVYQHKAQLYMCLPYMTEMAESLSNTILAKTPNMIIAVDTELKIVEFNNAAEKVFKVSRGEAVGKYLCEFIDTSNFEVCLETKESIVDKTVSYPEYNLITEQSITFVPEQNIIIGIFKDITAEEKAREKAYNLKIDTIDMAQNVIDKQMVVAQEIASLLGETTAETKVTLTKLKDMILYDGEDKN